MSKEKFILIVGGGHLGYYLAKALIKNGNEVVIVERDKSLASSLVNELGDSVVIGDGTELGVLKMAGVERADIIVTTTGYDEDNFTIAMIAKQQFRVPKAVSSLRDPNNEKLFKSCGIDETVCSTSVILNLLEQQIDSQNMIPITALDKGNIEVVSHKIEDFSPAIGVQVKNLGLPVGNLIISIIKEDKSYIPVGTSVLEAGDEVILLIPKGTSEVIEKYFVNSDN